MTEEQVDQIAEAVPEFVEAVGGVSKGFVAMAAVFSAFGGAALGYFVAVRRLEAKYAKISDDEIAGMREHYQEKARALEAQARKKPIEDIVKERGYSSPDRDVTKPPIAVQPPSAVMESEDERAGEPVETPPAEPEQVRNIFRDRHPEVEPVEHEWDLQAELRRRSPDFPYVIHIDERDEMDYDVVTLTYYEGDDVMCDERDNPLDSNERDMLVGEKNLERFGHGSNDPSIVYVRNDKLELVYEVVKSPNNYAEEVHGFKHDAGLRGNLERMRVRERDEQED